MKDNQMIKQMTALGETAMAWDGWEICTEQVGF